MEYGVRVRFTLTLRSVRSQFTCNISKHLAVYCKVRKANFTSFPSRSPGKTRAVFELNLGVMSKV